MKQFLFFTTVFLFVLHVSGQAGKNKYKNGKQKLLGDTTVVKNLERLTDSINNPVLYRDSGQEKVEASRNINAILDIQKEQRARQKKAAMTRIVIGVAFLLLLVIGLSRRKKNR
jgi:hypothetical protein